MPKLSKSETGLVIFAGKERSVVVVPPFPLTSDLHVRRFEADNLIDHLEQELLIGVVLLRLGYFVVGILDNENVMASKTGSRYVKNKHRAGGSSQRRFERSRERLIRELFDNACKVAQQVFGPYKSELDYLMLGGETYTLHRFINRCSYIQGFDHKLTKRILPVRRPGHEAMANISREVWRSQVVTVHRK
mgnify:CR=1 FL=1